MPIASTLTIPVEIRQRSLVGRLVRLPRVGRQHYRTFRRSGVGVIPALYGTWLMAGVLVTVGKR